MRDSEELLRLVHTAMVGAGVDYEAIYRQLEYTADTLAEPEHRTRHEIQKWFWATAEQVTGDTEIGLTLCPHLPAFRGNAMEYIFLSSPTLADGLNAVLDYRRLVSDAFHMDLVREPGGNRIVLAGTTNDAPALRHSEICFCYGFIKTMRCVTNTQFEPTAVTLRAPARLDRAEYEDVFACSVAFDGAESEIWVDDAVLEAPSPHQNPALLRLHRELADSQLARIRRQDLLDDVRLRLYEAFRTGECDEGVLSLDAIAEELGMSPRRLRFELGEAGTNFRELVRRTRVSLARQLLKRTKEPIDEVALCTGFSDRSTFCRAFREWTGETPVHYRHRKMESSSARAAT